MSRWLLLAMIGCGNVISIPDAPSDPDAPGGPPPPAFKVVSFQELGRVPQAGVIQARDGARSALLWGKSVWTFNTTVLNTNDVDGKNWHNNSFATTDDLVGNDGVKVLTETLDAAGAPVRLLDPTTDEADYNSKHYNNPCPVTPCGTYYDSRPMATLWDAARTRVVMLYELVFFQPPNETHLGRSVAIWSSLDTRPDRPVVSQREHPTVLFDGTEPSFGSAAQVVDGDLYAFGCDGDPMRFNSPCKLAKVPLDDVLLRSRWQFWDGATFSSKLEDAVELFTGNGLLSVAWNSHIQRWLAVYSEPLTNVVVARSAAALTGPWSAQVQLFVTPAPNPDRWTFDTALHDEYTENGGQTLYVSYSRFNTANGPFGDDVIWVRIDIAAVPPT
jgi:hypothetical protein